MRLKEVKTINITVFDSDVDKLSQFFTDLIVLFKQRSNAYYHNQKA